ncbi:MAG: T9SS type A sorting domain-containing protein [Pseudomonadota bacterium]
MYIQVAAPEAIKLDQNYPNPFTANTKIGFELPAEGRVTLELYDILGRKVDRLVDDDMPAGFHNFEYSANHLASGVYFYLLRAKGQDGEMRIFQNKMILAK